jgi:methanogenic corrinoid protein MtbC1
LSEKEVFESLRNGLLSLDEDATEKAAREVVKNGLNVIQASKILTEAIRIIGEQFSTHEIFLPDLMIAADAMNKGLAVLEPEMKKLNIDSEIQGTVLLGTVKGDIHDLGKSIVSTMLTAAGFTVIDIGKDVPASAFLAASKKYEPDIIGLSATMTTTTPIQKEVIEYFEALGAREKYMIIIGGAAVTPEYAEEIGADGFAEDMTETVKLAEKLMKKK